MCRCEIEVDMFYFSSNAATKKYYIFQCARGTRSRRLFEKGGKDAHPRLVLSLRIEPTECHELSQKRSHWTK